MKSKSCHDLKEQTLDAVVTIGSMASQHVNGSVSVASDVQLVDIRCRDAYMGTAKHGMMIAQDVRSQPASMIDMMEERAPLWPGCASNKQSLESALSGAVNPAGTFFQTGRSHNLTRQSTPIRRIGATCVNLSKKRLTTVQSCKLLHHRGTVLQNSRATRVEVDQRNETVERMERRPWNSKLSRIPNEAAPRRLSFKSEPFRVSTQSWRSSQG